MPELSDSTFLRACRGLPVDHLPVWFMRQAGRALPEYRALRATGTILDALADPALAAEITLQPVRRYGVDCAVLYSDIVVPVHAIGFGVEIRTGVGPVVERPFADESDLDRLRPLEPEADLAAQLETIRILRNELAVPLIGFAGAPFTLASYLVEGGPSREYLKTKALMYQRPDLWARLLDRLADISLASLRAQVAAGAQAVQLFDSWAGALNPFDYEHFVLPASRKVLGGMEDTGVPRIHFGVNTGELLHLMGEAGSDVVGVDWRVPLKAARSRIGAGRAIQGNLDPAIVMAGWPQTKATADRIVADGGGRGHIFNLGHGVLPGTDPGVLTELVAHIHSLGSVA